MFSGLFAKNLAAIRLPDRAVNFSLQNMELLKKANYDREMARMLAGAKPVELDTLLDDRLFSAGGLSPANVYQVVYHNPRDFRRLARKYNFMADFRVMFRTAKGKLVL